MAPPPPASGASRRDSLEQPASGHEPAPKEKPKTAAQLAEEREAKKMRVRGDTARQYASVSLENLGDRVKGRNYDHETPRLINEITLTEGPNDGAESQKRFDALRDVSAGIVTALFYNNAATGIKGTDFAHDVEIISQNIARINPGPTENAALNKLRIIKDHADSASYEFANEWTRIIEDSKKFSGDMAAAMSVRKAEPLKPEDEWTVKGFFHKHSKLVTGLAVAGAAIGGFFLVRGIYRHFTEASDHAAGETAPKAEEGAKKEHFWNKWKPDGVWGYLKWILGGAFVAFLIGKIGGLEKIKELAENLGEKASDAFKWATGENGDYDKNKALYDRMAERIGKDRGTSVNASFLALAGTKIKFAKVFEDEKWDDKLLDNPVTDAVSKIPLIGSSGLVLTQEQRQQIRVIRAYLQGSDRQRIISRIPYNDETMLGEILVKIDAELNKQGTAPLLADGAAGATGAAAAGSESGNKFEIGKVDAITDAQVEGTSERDEAAQKLPAETQKIYWAQRKALAELRADDSYLDTDKAHELITATGEAAAEIRKEASTIVDKSEQKEKQALAEDLDSKAKNLKTAVNTRAHALQEYSAAVKNNAGKDALNARFKDVINVNENVLKTSSLLTQKISEEGRLKHIAALSGMTFARAAYMYLTRPDHYKEFIRAHCGHPLFALPTVAASHALENMRRPKGGSRLTELRIQEGESRLTGELGGADASGAGNLKSRARPDITDFNALKEGQKPARQRYDAEKTVLEHDKKQLLAERELEKAEEKLAALRTAKKPGDAEISLLEKELSGKRSALATMHIERAKLEKEAISEAAHEMHLRLAKESAVNRMEWREIEDLSRRTAENNRDCLRAAETVTERIVQAVKRGAPASEVEALKSTFRDIVGTIPKSQKSFLQIFSRYWRQTKEFLKQRGLIGVAARQPLEDFRGNDGTAPSLKQARKVLANVCNLQKKGAATEVSPLFRVINKKFYFYTAMIGVAAGVGVATRDKNTDWKQAATQGVFDVAPGTGFFSDFYTAIKGKEIFTGRKVTGYERALVRPLLGCVGLASDILLFTGPLGIAFKGWLMGVRGGVEGARIARAEMAAGKAIGAAEKIVAKEAAEASAHAAAKTGAEAAASAGSAEGGRLMAALRKIQHAGMLATVALGVGGLTMSLVKSDEMEVPPEIAEIAGSDLQNLPAADEAGTPEAPPETSEMNVKGQM